MRVVSAALLLVPVAFGVWACTSKVNNNDLMSDQGTMTGAGGTQAAGITSNVAGPTTTGAPAAANNVVTGANNNVGNTTGGAVSVAGVTNGGVTNGSGGATSSMNTVSNNTSNGTGGMSAQCEDIRHPDNAEIDCPTAASWGWCSEPWFDGYCDQSCERCAATNTSGGGSTNNTTSTTSDNNTASNTTGSLGDDNPFGEVNGGQQGWASRYWDCCKPSCGWSGNASNPVKSCDVNNNNLGVSDETNGCELNGQSGAFTCHSMAPWAYSNQVSFGYAAINGVNCGGCFHVQFTGSSQRGGNGPGSAALAGKHMIVMATNIGGIEQGQFDLLIPGGGVGDFNGCSGQWGVDISELGARFGGFLSECRNENHDTTKSCMRQRCESVFQSNGLSELYDGCMWFVDWFQAADNPDFMYEPIDCPQELVNAAH
jgi:hypothetical protein